MPESATFEAFEAQARDAGFDAVLERRWAPGQVLDTHSHDFEVSALVAQGEMWLRCGDRTRHLPAGARFELAAGVAHAERYGAAGCTLWVARRHPQGD